MLETIGGPFSIVVPGVGPSLTGRSGTPEFMTVLTEPYTTLSNVVDRPVVTV